MYGWLQHKAIPSSTALSPGGYTGFPSPVMQDRTNNEGCVASTPPPLHCASLCHPALIEWGLDAARVRHQQHWYCKASVDGFECLTNHPGVLNAVEHPRSILCSDSALSGPVLPPMAIVKPVQPCNEPQQYQLHLDLCLSHLVLLSEHHQ
jgi:hypothetical protein